MGWSKDRLPLKLAIIITVPFCFFSVAASKLPWYVWCAYPFAAMLLVLPVTFALRLRHGKKRTLLLFLVGCTALVAELRAYDTKTRLEQKFHDPAQILLLRASEGGKGVRAYAQNGSWEPRHVLTSTMLGNIQLMPGGEDAFRRDDSPEKVLISLRPVN